MLATETKERPIIFPTPMVQAILEGRKTQTRRVIKGDFYVENDPPLTAYIPDYITGEPQSVKLPCPYGQIGDRLWVRETWSDKTSDGIPHICYKANYSDADARECFKWKPSIHMPRSASRITLEITGIRVEQLQDISVKDAIAEGSYLNRCSCYPAPKNSADSIIDTMIKQTWCHQHGDEFKTLWDSINAKKHPWQSNPWVWVIEFKRV